MAVEQVVSIKSLSGFVGEHEIIWLAELPVPGPHSLDCRKNGAMFVERHITLTGLRLHIVELIVVNTFVHDDAITKDVLPPKGECFTGPHRGEDD